MINSNYSFYLGYTSSFNFDKEYQDQCDSNSLITESFLKNEAMAYCDQRFELGDFLRALNLKEFPQIEEHLDEVCYFLEHSGKEDVIACIGDMRTSTFQWSIESLYYPFTSLAQRTYKPEVKLYLKQMLSGFVDSDEEDVLTEVTALNHRFQYLKEDTQLESIRDEEHLFEILVPEKCIRDNLEYSLDQKLYLQCAFEKVYSLVKGKNELDKLLPKLFESIALGEYSAVINNITKLHSDDSLESIAKACLNCDHTFLSVDAIVACIDIKMQMKKLIWNGLVPEVFAALTINDNIKLFSQNKSKNSTDLIEALKKFDLMDVRRLSSLQAAQSIFECVRQGQPCSIHPQTEVVERLLDTVIYYPYYYKHKEQVVSALLKILLESYPENAQKWCMAHIDKDSVEQRAFVLGVMRTLNSSKEEFFYMHEERRRFTNLGCELGMSAYLGDALSKRCRVVSMRDLTSLQWSFPFFTIIEHGSHYVGVYSCEYKKQPVAIIFDSLDNQEYTESVANALPVHFEKIILSDPLDFSNLCTLQSDKYNCSIFCLEAAKQFLKYPELSKKIIERKTGNALKLADLPWRLYLGVQSVQKVHMFAKLLNDDDAKLFLEKTLKYIRKKPGGKLVNNRINDKSRKLERVAVAWLLKNRLAL